MTAGTSTTYPVPPIAEAIIEFRFDKALGDKAQGELSEKLARFYPDSSETPHLEFSADLDTFSATVSKAGRTITRSSSDATENALIAPESVTFTQLPVYPGWDIFIDRVRRDWRVAKDTLGYRKLSRIGVRYVNKFDFPFKEELVEPTDYLKVYIQHPDVVGHMIQSSFQSVHRVAELKAIMRLQSGTIESLLPGHIGILLDIDIGSADEIPQRDDVIFEWLDKVRNFKNTIFEASITDVTRERFYDTLRIGS